MRWRRMLCWSSWYAVVKAMVIYQVVKGPVTQTSIVVLIFAVLSVILSSTAENALNKRECVFKNAKSWSNGKLQYQVERIALRSYWNWHKVKWVEILLTYLLQYLLIQNIENMYICILFVKFWNYIQS